MTCVVYLRMKKNKHFKIIGADFEVHVSRRHDITIKIFFINHYSAYEDLVSYVYETIKIKAHHGNKVCRVLRNYVK